MPVRKAPPQALRHLATARRTSNRPPYRDWLGEATYEVCPMCEFEFGNDDDPVPGAEPMSFAEYRAEWESRGSPVFRPADVADINATRERTS